MKYDVIVIGGGLAGTAVAEGLQKNGLSCAIVSAGHSIHNVSYRAFENAGGDLLMGDTVTDGRIEDNRLVSISTEKLGKDVLEAGIFVLATGKFFGCGIKADMDGVCETVLGCDIAVPERESWFDKDFAKDQPFLTIGVKTDDRSRVSIDGKTLENVFATGEVKEGITGAVKDGDDTIKNDAKQLVNTIKEVCHAGE